MHIKTLKLVYFSPTGTTKAIVQKIAKELSYLNIEIVDLTSPNSKIQSLNANQDDLIVIGLPVYMGRIPSILIDWLKTLKGCSTPAVGIVVYGNRTYGDSLLELTNILIEQKCKPIACAAFIGEHSFSGKELLIAHGRPDTNDFVQAQQLANKIKDKLSSFTICDSLPDLSVPGNVPYEGTTTLWDVDFIEVSEDCSQCGICAEKCPVSAVHRINSNIIDIKACITCCACIKSCPQNARSIKSGLVNDAALRLSTLYKERKEPCFFI